MNFAVANKLCLLRLVVAPRGTVLWLQGNVAIGLCLIAGAGLPGMVALAPSLDHRSTSKS